ncbi:MAG TPA: DUF1592 domain-containing protein [Verrucomicrobiales bacterium]|nr:DUF1592 domain-containing protein [Verrucomicrobiales bacterium]
MKCSSGGIVLATMMAMVLPAPAKEGGLDAFAGLDQDFEREIKPLLERFCCSCHSTEKQKGDLDLERFTSLATVRTEPEVWRQVAEQLAAGEMPPEGEPQPEETERERLSDWVRVYLEAEARARAGDPGRVVLRRLSNVEYDRVVRHLTGLDLGLASEFPADGAAGEGFTNTGQALVMSPAMIDKYFEAAKSIAGHAMLLPDGFRFSAGTTRRDREDELLDEIRAIHGPWLNEAGRLELAPYFAETIRRRNGGRDPGYEDGPSNLNRKFLDILLEALRGEKDDSLLLDALRERWREAGPGDAAALAEWVGAWQEALFRFNNVGHFNAWCEAVDPVAEKREFRVPLESPEGAVVDRLYLVSSPVVEGSGRLRWKGARLEGGGRPPVALVDIREMASRLARLRGEALAQTEVYLKAVAEAMDSGNDDTIAASAQRHGLHEGVLEAWMIYLGAAGVRSGAVEGLLTEPLRDVGGYGFVSGWGFAETPSVVANASGDAARIPGNLRARGVALHPAPNQFAAAGWRSPLSGTVRVEAAVSDAHPECGNGVSWSLELRRGPLRRPLAGGTVNTGQAMQMEPLDALPVQTGDLLSLMIGPRDGNHVCDLTAIDFIIVEQGGDGRRWSVSEDVSAEILAGNPHRDSYGNAEIWFFYRGDLGKEGLVAAAIEPGSQPARWLDARDADERTPIATRIGEILRGSVEPGAKDAGWAAALRRLDGPLFGNLDPAGLPEAPFDPAEENEAGVDPSVVVDGDLAAGASSAIELRWPADWVGGREFVVEAVLDPGAEGAFRCAVDAQRPEGSEAWRPGDPVLAAPGSRARETAHRSLESFRALFPAALCYRPIIPVDEVITLALFHREDEALQRLLLDDDEASRLDRLWTELRFVSHDAIRIDAIFDDFMGYASQEGQTARFEPLRQPIRMGAEAQREERREAEAAQLAELLRFAERAWRRPLTEAELDQARDLYARERSAGIEHEEAFRAVLARVLLSSHFLYKIEAPPEGMEAGPVNAWELATRLSFFLWSTSPDEALRESAAAGRLAGEEELLRQTRRMLADSRVRALAEDFAAQWLGVRNFDEHNEKNEALFPHFAGLRAPFYEEVIRFFEDLFRNDGPVLSILDADHSFLNAALAEHYGLAAGTAGEWTRVEGMRRLRRGGILGMGAVLAKQSGASRTSPVLRGTWVVETLLGEDLPNPPPNVPQIPDDGSAAAGLSVRELTERHRSVAECAHCHERIDPYGFALEAFDAVGAWREIEESGHPVDTSVVLRDGTAFTGLEGLREHLERARRGDWTRQFCRKLLGYALGRSTTLSDEPLLEEMLRALEAEDWRVSAAIETVVKSRQFRYHRGKEDQS